MVAPEEQESPEQQCVYATEAYLPLLLDDYYLHGALDQRRTQVAQTIVEGVIGTYRDLLRNDSDGLFSPHLPRDVALDKLEHAQVILGAPSHWKELMQFQDRPRVGEDFLENVLRIRGYHKRHLEELFAERPYQPLEAERLFDGLLHVDNAFYMHQLNAIVINAGILQEPLFSPDREPEVQYGRLGVVVAHELSHAFDRTGTHFDRLGSVVDPAWMDGAAFERDTHYLVDLYTRHSYLRNLNDGQRTLDENIADQYGLHVAWRALLRAKPDASFERFRLAFAQVYCDAVDRGVERKLAQRASHSINSVRVNAGLSTFSCPLRVH
jgi:putative endopeptidase